MTPYLHWLLLANGVLPIVWIVAGQQDYRVLMQATTWAIFALTVVNLIAAGAVWP